MKDSILYLSTLEVFTQTIIIDKKPICHQPLGTCYKQNYASQIT